MEPVVSRSGCYCCCSRPSSRGIDVDSALSELGMLSSPMDCRAQYIREKARRAMANLSLGNASGSSQAGEYQIVSVNTKFVTGMSSASINKDSSIFSANAQSSIRPSSSDSQLTDRLGLPPDGYRQCEPAKASRFSRMKLARIRRFKKPYEVPWRLSHASVHLENDSSTLGSSGDVTTPPSTPKIAPYISKSNSNTPEKPRSAESLHRSQSMDDLNITNLPLAAAGNRLYRDELKEIDSMAKDMKDLQVNDAQGSKIL